MISNGDMDIKFLQQQISSRYWGNLTVTTLWYTQIGKCGRSASSHPKSLSMKASNKITKFPVCASCV